MAMIPITTVAQTESVSQDASVLITQPVEDNGASIETLMRAKVALIAAALKARITEDLEQRVSSLEQTVRSLIDADEEGF